MSTEIQTRNEQDQPIGGRVSGTRSRNATRGLGSRPSSEVIDIEIQPLSRGMAVDKGESPEGRANANPEPGMRPGADQKEHAMWPDKDPKPTEKQTESQPDEPTVTDMTPRITEQRERNEAAEAMAFAPALPPPEPPGRVAYEMHRRSRYLRTKTGPVRTHKVEQEVLGELDTIEAQARDLEERQKRGVLAGAELASELTKLALAAFAVRGRFRGLLATQDLAVPPQAQRPSPEERQRELDAIERFMQQKQRRKAA